MARATMRLGAGVVLAVTGFVLPAAVPAGAEQVSQTSVAPQVQTATRRAQAYLRVSSFSRSRLIDQLVFEKFSRSVATSAVGRLRVDWNKQAEARARAYLRMTPMSQSRLLDQLRFERFTESEVAYARRHIYPARTPSRQTDKPLVLPERSSFSKTMDICNNYTGSGVATLVSKGTSCEFGSTILDTYDAITSKTPSKARKTLTFTARSAATHKRYPVRCQPRHNTHGSNGMRYYIVSCASGRGYRAKIEGSYRIYS